MKLTAYPTRPDAPQIIACPPARGWMDGTPGRYAYKCLPLSMANRQGWALLNPVGFTAAWDGRIEPAGLRIVADGADCRAISHFGSGVVTFDVGYLFRTEPGHNLTVRGLPNEAKDGIAPLEGLVETDWLPYTFTMNWRFTRPGEVRFEPGEPFSVIVPTPRGYLESVLPEVSALDSDAVLDAEYRAWITERYRFDAERAKADTPERRRGWKMDYLNGRTATGKPAPEHQTRLDLKPFELRSRA